VRLPSRITSCAAAVILAAASAVSLAAPASAADFICNQDSGVCDETASTPAGSVDVTVSPTNVVTVRLTPISPRTVVFGVPFGVPPAPASVPGLARTSVATTGGAVDIDTLVFSPRPSGRPSPPNVVVISIHPPSPCRAVTTGTTVTFTPIVG
jgi:hypothetical protein